MMCEAGDRTWRAGGAGIIRRAVPRAVPRAPAGHRSLDVIERSGREAVHLIEGLLANDCDIQPSTVHADTQGQSVPVFTLATLFGFDLMPRIRNLADLIFFRASAHLIYPHIDELFGERGRNVIDWQL